MALAELLLAPGDKGVAQSIIRERKRNFERIKQNLYLVEIQFTGLTKTCTLSWTDLDFDEEMLKNIRKSKIRLRGIPLFEQLEDKAKILRSMRSEWESRRTILVCGERLVTESQFENCIRDIIEIKKVADKFRQELLKERDRGLQLLLDKIINFLESFQVEEDLRIIKLRQIAKSFPSEIEINNLLKVKATYTRVSSLIEQLNKEKESELLINHDLEIEHIRELRQSQQLEIDRLKKLKDDVFEEARLSILAIVSEHISKLDKIEIGKPNKRLRDKLANHIVRLGAFLDLDMSGNLSSIAENLSELHEFLAETIDYNISREVTIFNRFNDLKNKLEVSRQQILEVGEET